MEESEIKIGTPVIYWGVIKLNGERFDPIKTEIISEPWKLGHGEVVCKVKHKSGGVSIRHLDKISPGSLMAAKIAGLKDVDNDFEKETVNFFARPWR